MSCDCESPTCWIERTRKARKPHRCAECDDPIRINESYAYGSGVWEGSGFSYKRHSVCAAWSNALHKYADAANYCICPELGSLNEGLIEYCREVLQYDPVFSSEDD